MLCVILVGLLVISFYPLYQMLILSLRPIADINNYISHVQSSAVRFVPVYLLPRQFSLEQFVAAFDNIFVRTYITSLLHVAAITVLHFPIAFILGFMFAKATFKGRDVLFFCFIASMVLPFHVTVVPLNQILHHLRLLDTHWAVIVPGIFAPLGVFLLRQFIRQVPDDILEYASIDGAGTMRIIISIILPTIRAGLMVFFLLTIINQWGAIEPALAFIQDTNLLPTSVWLRGMMLSNPGSIFAPSVLYALPIFTLIAVLVRINKVDICM